MEDSRIKKKHKKGGIADKDRISKLSDDVIHQIMLYLDARLAVRTSVLSKRWKLVWTTLPYLNFNGHNEHYEEKLSKFIYIKFINHVFARRNHQTRVLNLQLCPFNGLNLRSIKKYVKYAISRGVERLHVKSDRYCPLSIFRSNSLKELKLRMKFESDKVMEWDFVSLPNLSTLFLNVIGSCFYEMPKFQESCLTTLSLKKCVLPEFFSLPSLTTLYLKSCTLPKNVWDCPALLTLELGSVVFPKNMSEYFIALSNLRNLSIDFSGTRIGCCVISSSHLVNLKIKVSIYTASSYASEDKIVVLAPKLCNFDAIGFFRMTYEGSELENVDIKFWDDRLYMSGSENARQYFDVFKIMLSQLGSAKILSLDLVTIKVLSQISDIHDLHCPFYNLKYLKLPHGCEEPSISSSVRQYLLGDSPCATIVKTKSRDDIIPKMAPAISLSDQNVVLEESSATPTKDLIASMCTHKSTGGDTVNVGEPKEHMVENSVVDADKVSQIKAPVAVASNDRASSSLDNSYLVLWRGYKVNSEYVGLLDEVMKRYPETFEQLPKNNNKLWTTKLNTLCSFVNVFTKTSKSKVDIEMLAEYRALFTDLQRWGFNLNWLMSHLDYIEQLWFSKPLLYELHAIDSSIDDAKSKLHDLQTLRAEKLANSESSRTVGTSLAVTAGYIGDDIL